MPAAEAEELEDLRQEVRSAGFVGEKKAQDA